MVILPERRSLLLACQRQDRPALRAPLEAPLFRAWDVGDADSIEQTRYMLQMTPRDVLLLDAALYRESDPQAVSWLAASGETPLLLLGEPESRLVVSALRQGARQWLPRQLALQQPDILEATLQQLALVGDAHRKARAVTDELDESRRQVNRLVSLLWESAPADGRRPWFPQRHMLQRLEEEVALSKRHGDALTVVLGEVFPAHAATPSEVCEQLASWTATQVAD
jgi:hypothetical protein